MFTDDYFLYKWAPIQGFCSDNFTLSGISERAAADREKEEEWTAVCLGGLPITPSAPGQHPRRVCGR